MKKDKLKKNLVGIGKDILTAFIIVCIVMLCLYAYCGIWPPMVVVESGSMQHSDTRSYLGVIDTGDMVLVKRVGGAHELVTYVDGEASGYSKYGAFGDVVIFRPDGLTVREDGSTVVPIIHRLVVWIDVNETMVSPDFDGIDYANYTFDVPSLEIYASTDMVILERYGHRNETVRINLGGLLAHYEMHNREPHGGYITMGDNNAPFYDQPLSGSYELVRPEWIVGKAVGEIPWFGLIKLKVTGAQLYGVPGNSWVNLYITIFLMLLLPFLFDMMAPRFNRWRKGHKKDTGPPPGEVLEPLQGMNADPEPVDTGSSPGAEDIQK